MVEREAFCISQLVSKMETGELDSCPIYADLLRFPWQKYAGLVDILSAGFPCQPFSNAGLRESTEDERHLWPHIKTGISILGCPVCFFENVDGIASAKSPGYHSVLHHVLSDLEAMGYRATAGQFSAQEVGAPHLRKRWFILGLAHPNSDPRNQGESRRASGEVPATGPGLRRGQGEGQTGQESWGCSQLAYGECKGLEGFSRDEYNPLGSSGSSTQIGPVAESGIQRWPTRPGHKQHEWEPPRAIEPGLGRHPDGIPDRVDRLRALGNAVVPQVAAKAFSVLFNRLNTPVQ